MAKRALNLPVSGRVGPRLRIMLRISDWSEWGRLIICGAQEFAISRPDWQLHVSTGTEAITENLGDIRWDGIMTHVFPNVRGIRRLWKDGRTKLVSFTAVPHKALLHLPSVRVNESKIAQAIGHHLLSGGFRNFAYLTHEKSYPIVDLRFHAAQEFARSVQCHFSASGPGPDIAVPPLNFVRRWVRSLRKPVGIFARNTPVAISIVQGCIAAGISVPDEAAVVSWDENSLLAGSISPSVSAAVYPAARVGYEAAALLDRLVRCRAMPKEPVIVEPTGMLHIRESSDVSAIPDRAVSLAAQYIQERVNKPMAVSELARELLVSRSKLQRDFRRVMGKTLKEAIMTAHLERATQLLLETPWPLGKLARAAGFGTTRHFHRTFVRTKRITPMEYRRRFAIEMTRRALP
jgi:LacI family transcriptional regulator